METVASLLAANVASSIVEIPVPSVTLVSWFWKKAVAPSVVTEFGIVTEANWLLENAPLPITAKPLLSVRDVSLLLSKAL
jgi:hypothetical protein